MSDLARLELLRHFTPEDLQELEKYTTRVDVEAGEPLWGTDNGGNTVHIIEHGEVVIMRNGHVSNILRSGEVFWEGILFGTEARFLEAVARTNVVGYEVEGEAFLAFLRAHPAEATGFLLTVLDQITHRLYNTTQLFETVIGLEQIGSAMDDVNDLSDRARQLIEQALLNTNTETGCAAFVWNRFDQSYDLLYRKGTTIDADLCRQFAKTEEQESYLEDDESIILGIHMVEGSEHLGIVFLERKGIGKTFYRLEEIVFNALAQQLALLVHRHQEVKETAALFRLKSRTRWNF